MIGIVVGGTIFFLKPGGSFIWKQPPNPPNPALVQAVGSAIPRAPVVQAVAVPVPLAQAVLFLCQRSETLAGNERPCGTSKNCSRGKWATGLLAPPVVVRLCNAARMRDRALDGSIVVFTRTSPEWERVEMP